MARPQVRLKLAQRFCSSAAAKVEVEDTKEGSRGRWRESSLRLGTQTHRKPSKEARRWAEPGGGVHPAWSTRYWTFFTIIIFLILLAIFKRKQHPEGSAFRR